MGRWRVAALAAVMCITSAICALAQVSGDGQKVSSPTGVRVEGWSRADSTARLIPTNAAGTAVPTSDATLAAQTVITKPSIIVNASLAAGAGDTSQVLDVHTARHMKLLIKATPLGAGADTITVIRLIFQFRECWNAQVDSMSLFPEYSYAQVAGPGISATAADTAAAGHLFGGNDFTPWSGEYDVYISSKRSAHASSVAVNGHTWYYPNGISLPLDSVFGREARFNQLQVRVRNGSSAASAGGGKAVSLTVHLLGFVQ